LWDVEANMTDVKTYDVDRAGAGEPLHNMWVRLTLDTTFVIRDIESAMDAYPRSECPYAVNPMKDLIGVKIGAGWQGEVRKRIGGALGCTHLRELLAPIGERSDAVLRTATGERSDAVLRTVTGDHRDAGDGRCPAQPWHRPGHNRTGAPARRNPTTPIARTIAKHSARATVPAMSG
jgi:hypothetical protein